MTISPAYGCDVFRAQAWLLLSLLRFGGPQITHGGLPFTLCSRLCFLLFCEFGQTGTLRLVQTLLFCLLLQADTLSLGGTHRRALLLSRGLRFTLRRQCRPAFLFDQIALLLLSAFLLLTGNTLGLGPFGRRLLSQQFGFAFALLLRLQRLGLAVLLSLALLFFLHPPTHFGLGGARNFFNRAFKLVTRFGTTLFGSFCRRALRWLRRQVLGLGRRLLGRYCWRLGRLGRFRLRRCSILGLRLLPGYGSVIDFRRLALGRS